MTSSEIRGAMADSVRIAKSRFAKIETERIREFIEQQADIVGPVAIGPVAYPTDGAGSSNGIAFLTASLDRGAGPETLDLVLRFSPGAQLLKQKKYDHEFATLKALEDSGLPVPEVLWLDKQGAWLGTPGYIMMKVEGDTPSAAMYSAGPLANVSPEVRNELMLKAAGFHGQLRKSAIKGDRVPHLVDRGDGHSAVARELNWWMEEVRLAWDLEDSKARTVNAVRQWLLQNEPDDLYAPGLVHGDAQIANIIYNQGEIAAVVDWELSYLGHNESDLALICFLTEAQKLTDVAVDGTPTEADFIDRYERESGLPVVHWPYFKLFNLYKIVAVSLLTAHLMPSFEQVWTFYSAWLDRTWLEAKSVYGRD